MMDADLQHSVNIILKISNLWNEGMTMYILNASTEEKKAGWESNYPYSITSYYKKTTQIQILQNVGDFYLPDRKYINILKQFRECKRNTKECIVGLNFIMRYLLWLYEFIRVIDSYIV